eukprot:56793_1
MVIKKLKDEKVEFYKSTFDALHYYILHLFETGMRTPKMNDGDNDNKTAEDDNNEYFDAKFTRIANLIAEKQETTKRFHRFKSNNKFNIGFEEEKKDESSTVMDELYSYLLAKNITKKTVRKIQKYIEDEEYDTDSLKMGQDSPLIGNIKLIPVSKTVAEVIKEFINVSTIKSSSFNIGIIFYYWPKYRGMKQFNQNRNKYNINDHGGYKFADLHVEQKFTSFKEEISHYKHFNRMQYKDLVVKINEYLRTETTKKMKAGQGNIKLEYAVEKDAILSFYHLLCVLLYTDYTELSSDFSSTF